MNLNTVRHTEKPKIAGAGEWTHIRTGRTQWEISYMQKY